MAMLLIFLIINFISKVTLAHTTSVGELGRSNQSESPPARSQL